MTESSDPWLLLDALDLAVIATDRNGLVTYWNSGAERLYGWMRAETVGRSIMEVTPAVPAREQGEDIFRSVLEQARTWRGDYQVSRRDGSSFLANVSLAPVLAANRGVVGVVGTSRDVTRARLARVAESVAYGGSLTETLDALAQTIAYANSISACTIALTTPESGVLRIRGCWGLPVAYPRCFADVMREEPDHPARRALVEGSPVVLATEADACMTYANNNGGEVRACDTEVWLPLVARDHPIGVLGAFLHAQGLDERSVLNSRLSGLARQAGVAVDSALLFQAAQADATLQERRRVSRELHDSLSQTLYSITLLARAAELGHERSEESGSRDLSLTLHELRELSQSALAETREMILGLRPEGGISGDLVATLERRAKVMTARHGLPISVEGPATVVALRPDAEDPLVRIVVEALTNVVRHSAASRAWVRVSCDDVLTVEVQDNGCGFDLQQRKPGRLGLDSMRERARTLGGLLEIISAPGAGTTVRTRCHLATIATDSEADPDAGAP